MAWYFQYEFDIYKVVKAGDYSHPEYFIFQFLKNLPFELRFQLPTSLIELRASLCELRPDKTTGLADPTIQTNSRRPFPSISKACVNLLHLCPWGLFSWMPHINEISGKGVCCDSKLSATKRWVYAEKNHLLSIISYDVSWFCLCWKCNRLFYTWS